MRGLDPVMVRFNKGLHEIGNGCWAWIEPDGSWGWSNAGLITSGECSLLVDTLYDPHMTRSMLSAMRDASAAARQIDMLVNTHADGDHTYGNRDRKSTRLNSRSLMRISYAVFCLKKKKRNNTKPKILHKTKPDRHTQHTASQSMK